ncbi:unnamed protein product [Arctogadus glacialis]
MTTGAEQNGTRQVSPLLSHLWGLACVMMSRCVQVLLLLKANHDMCQCCTEVKLEWPQCDVEESSLKL